MADLSLNAGCGEIILDDMINLDIRQLPGVDIVADIRNLPFKNCAFNRVFCSDAIEHIGHREYFATLEELCRVCNRTLLLKTLALDKLVERYYQGEIGFGALQLLLYGGQDYPENYHHCVMPSNEITKWIESRGFKIDESNVDIIGNLSITAHRRLDLISEKPGPKSRGEAKRNTNSQS